MKKKEQRKMGSRQWIERMNHSPYMTLVKNIATILTMLSVIVSAIFLVFQSWTMTKDNTNSIQELQNAVKQIDYSINGNPETGAVGINSRLDTMEGYMEIVKITASRSAQTVLGSVSVKGNGAVATTVDAFSADLILGVDEEGQACLAKDYKREQILLTYTEEEKEVFFLGQYNENYQWDGYCVTNAYFEDGTLYGICESDFSDGERQNYKSFVFQEEGEWLYSNRDCKKDNNIGENKTYRLDYKKEKNFTPTNVRTTDILYVDSFIEKTDSLLMSYYNGKTLDGQYNDTSGQAYYVSFYEDGTVKTLYQGCMQDGQFVDETGEAWYITSNRENGVPYMYYSGKFDIKPQGETEESMYDLSKKEIARILKEKNCTLDILWK